MIVDRGVFSFFPSILWSRHVRLIDDGVPFHLNPQDKLCPSCKRIVCSSGLAKDGS